MSDLAAVSEFIRFGIDRLSARNGHHEFEHLCRHFARLRISPWVIPATGPVSAGGDQGRDFESFLSFLKLESAASTTHWLAAHEGDQRLAFGCTLQAENLSSKIKTDVTKIGNGHPPASIIYYFLGAGLPVATRHQLQAWALESFSITLEIIDGDALAEHLSARDLFWIAQRFLQIPYEIYPASEDVDSDYARDKERWLGISELNSVNFSGFSEIRSLARFSLYEKKEDILLWIDLINRVSQGSEVPGIRRAALYEFLAVSMRNERSFIGLENRVEEFLDGLSNIDEPSEMENALVILGHSTTSHFTKAANFEEEKLKGWCDMAWRVVSSNLDAATSPMDRCHWLKHRGDIEIHLGLVLHGFLDFDKVFEYWIAFVDEVARCPTFPLSTFADTLTALIQVIGHHDSFDELCQKVDSLVGHRAGNARAADNCRDRAVAFYESGDVLKAIDQIHKAKIGWFSGDTIEGSLIACHVLSGFYLELGLGFAAKYYALVEAYISHHSEDDELSARIPNALCAVMRCVHAQGHWFSYWKLGKTYVMAHSAFAANPFMAEKDSDFRSFLVSEYHSIVVTERLFNPVADLVRKLHSELGLDSQFDALLDDARAAWKGLADHEMQDHIMDQLEGVPWSDLGPMVVADFKAFGIKWRFTWGNNREMTAAAEEFLAVLQISLVELARCDACLLGGDVNVTIVGVDGDDLNLKALPSNSGSQWEMRLPSKIMSSSGSQGVEVSALVAAIAKIIRSMSLVPEEDFGKMIVDRWLPAVMKNGFFGQTYRVVYCWMVSDEDFAAVDRLPWAALISQWEVERYGAGSLKCQCSISDAIKQEELIEGIAGRYERCLPPIRITITRLRGYAPFDEIRRKFSREGWKDWHFLLSIFNIAMNYRSRSLVNSSASAAEIQKALQDLSSKPEEESDELIPLEMFDEEWLKSTLRITMVSTLQGHGFNLYQSTPNFQAIEDFLSEKLQYWTLDIEHEPIF
ncbi:hypothetical protein [Luteolibacter sp. Populi]|uniref:hypothetical protein n=1 Tax=Luteolibacter sp. Populi TaxID=3230487 RepID=UPI00346656A5